jgi:predicted nucleic acid-binding protein
MNGKTFLDTNILIYAYDLDAGAKHVKSKAIVDELWETKSGLLSTQVLQEFYVNATRKLAIPLPRPFARSLVLKYKTWCTEITHGQIVAAFQIEDECGIGFWDALIVAAAAHSRATKILSEDLNSGQRYAGILVENPFASARR